MHHHEEKSLQRLPVRQVREVREALSPEPAHPQNLELVVKELETPVYKAACQVKRFIKL